MPQTSPAYISRIRKQIHAAEEASDASLLANLELMRSIVSSRQTEKVPTPYVGQQALIRLGRAVQGQITIANDIFRAHEELHRIAKQELMVSGEEDKPNGFSVPDEAAAANAA
jgi:hypothetical protein